MVESDSYDGFSYKLKDKVRRKEKFNFSMAELVLKKLKIENFGLIIQPCVSISKIRYNLNSSKTKFIIDVENLIKKTI